MANNKKKRVPEEGLLGCTRCLKKKPFDEFGMDKSRPYADGTPRFKSYCKQCDGEHKKTVARRRSTERIYAELAPREAMKRLILERPEIFADVVKRYRQFYEPLLQEERERMLTKHEFMLERIRDSERIRMQRNRRLRSEVA